MSQNTSLNDNPPFCATVAVDIGALCTGAFLISHQNTSPTAEDCQASTIIMPKNGKQMTYSVQQRRAVRHRLRSQKRFTLARRLLLQIIHQQLKAHKIELNPIEAKDLHESLSGLLHRRGFNRLTCDIPVDLSVLDSLDPAVFAEHPTLSQFFHTAVDLPTQWENLTQDIALIGEFLKVCPNSSEFGKFLTKQFIEYQPMKSAYQGAIKLFVTEGTVLIDQMRFGHRHRTTYLAEILQDMQTDSRLKPAIAAFGDITRLWRLVGNLSNLQLRAVRWYFNAPELFDDKQWQPVRLRQSLIRAFKFFHFDKGEASKKQQDLIKLLESADDIVETLCSIDPTETIPPYEDQDNRRPPLDLTLLLSPTRLTSLYGANWKAWATAFAKKEPILEENLDLILASTDRRSRIKAQNPQDAIPSALEFRLSYILQRVLDRSKPLDQYALRALAKDFNEQRLTQALTNLGSTIGSQHVDSFIELARIYYAETARAREGLWLERDAKLLERSDIHPPKKQKMLNQLVGDLFGLNASFGQHVIDNLWTAKLNEKSRSSMRSACQYIETIRKKYGGEFALVYKRACRHFELGQNLSVEKELKLVFTRVEAIREFLIAQGVSEYAVKRISNPFSCAQLYTLIELDRAGFSSNCIAVQLENAWRMSRDENNHCAQCSRLPCDPVRPFDGVLVRVLKRQAHELAKLTVENLKSKIQTEGRTIHLAVVVEENKFAFSADLNTLKGASTKHPSVVNAKDRLARQTSHWLNKEDRLKAASRSICAYTGLTLEDHGEIDHIIPRTYSSKLMGTAFNSEVNLIYVSRKGNQIKQEQRYFLHQLHPRYLQAVFKTDNLATIATLIEDRIQALHQKHRLQFFDLLSIEDQDCVRHALFLDDNSEARRLVLAKLATTNKTRVNGVQAWFLKRYLEQVYHLAGGWLTQHKHSLIYRAYKANVKETSDIRTALGKLDPAFKKGDIQGIASHAVDAMCAYASLCSSDEFCRFTQSSQKLSNTESLEDLRALFPSQTKAIPIAARPLQTRTTHDSRPLFKEGIYGEHFLPLMVVKGRLYVGFTLPKADSSTGNALLVDGKNPLAMVETVSAYLDKTFEAETHAPRCYHVNAHQVFALFNKEALHPEQLTEEERAALPVLHALYYTTQRIPITKRLLDQTTLVRPEDKKLFNITVDLKSNDYRIKGTLCLPAKADWDRIINHPDLQDKYGQKLKDLTDFNLEDWLKTQHRMNSSKREHTPVSRFASLPICDNPSGGYRIRRTSFDGQTIYQLYAFDTATLQGFAANEDGQVDWEKPILMSHLRHKNVTPKDISTPNSSQQIVPLNEFRKIAMDDDITVFLAPNSKSRPLIRLVMPFTMLREWLKNAEANCQPSHPFELPATVKLSKADRFIPEHSHWASFLPSPRKDSASLAIEEVGTLVQITYQASTNMHCLKEAYNRRA